MTAEIYIEEATATGDAPEASLEELLAFERLLAWLSSRFANVSGDKLETEIESALRQLLQFLDFDRGTFGEFTADGWATILCSVAKDRVEPYPPGPAPAFLSWYLGQLRAEKSYAFDRSMLFRRRRSENLNTFAGLVSTPVSVSRSVSVVAWSAL